MDIQALGVEGLNLGNANKEQINRFETQAEIFKKRIKEYKTELEKMDIQDRAVTDTFSEKIRDLEIRVDALLTKINQNLSISYKELIDVQGEMKQIIKNAIVIS